MSSSVKRVGFVDFNADNFHAKVFLKALHSDLPERGFRVAGCHALQTAPSQAWAAANGVPYFDDPAALNAACDYFMVLAPSNPEVHLQLCERVFPFGKPTYVDKTFAPDHATAQRIFALADRHGVCVQTTSALRYTAVQQAAREAGAGQVQHMVAWGGGSNFPEYSIHPTELVVSCMGPEVVSMMRRGTGQFSQLLLNFTGDRTAVINVYCNAGVNFAATLSTPKATTYIPVDGARLFIDTAAAILDFLAAAKPNIDRRESLTIRRILDLTNDPAATQGFVKL
jgi:predicted dehydrogenase